MQQEVRMHVKAAPERVYELISDVTRMGEWSPECHRCEWLDGASGPAVGARFKGYNKRGPVKWSTTPEVLVADPGREFAFVTKNGKGQEMTRWRYRFEPVDGGTEVVESCEVLHYPTALKIVSPPRFRMGQVHKGMQATLERLKAVAERG